MTPCLSAPVKLYGADPWLFARVGQPDWRLCGSMSEEAGWKRRCSVALGGLLRYGTGAPPAAVLVVVPRVGRFGYIPGCPVKLAVSSPPQPPLGLQPEVMRLYFPLNWNPGLQGLAAGLGWLTHRVLP